MRVFPAALALLMAAPCVAQQSAAIPDPATIALPDMSGSDDAEVWEDGWKHFYFHKEGVSFAEAYADFEECYRFLNSTPLLSTDVRLPMFAPWRERAPAKALTPQYSYGLVGAVIGGIVAGPLERRGRQSRMRRCLEPRGYVRYALREKSWEKLIDDYSSASIALQAKAASGPKPNGKVVTR